MTYIRGREAAGIWIQPDVAVKVADEVRQLQGRNAYVADLLLQGMTRTEIAKHLRWNRRSLDTVLRDFLTNIRHCARGEDITRRLYRADITT